MLTSTDYVRDLDVVSIAGNTGPWTASTLGRQDIKRSLGAGMSWIWEVSGHDRADLLLSMQQAVAIGLSPEMQFYVRDGRELDTRVIGGDYGETIPGTGIPKRLYGVNVVVADVEVPTLVAPHARNAKWRVRFLGAL